MLKVFGKVTGPNIELAILTTKTAQSPNLTTGRVLNNAPNPGNAEVLECAREVDGAPVSTDARDPHSQPKLQASLPLTEQHDTNLIGLTA